ncbi:54S ribosomal protein yml6, mitochondrial [Lachnellula occidentalis]|uniref:Large ribosomal subunit protein uL4m n=1 Tax=Lachnellula occidentalis TaxID=215460 RepID=A0A8H8RKI4_9HELO|nr:54S ribosomal protein yml6, mitochondrial [Lachnellula occidentalis]
MASKGLQGFTRSARTLRTLGSSKDPLTQCLAPRLSRSMAIETSLPSSLSQEYDITSLPDSANTEAFSPPTVLTTIYKFPTMEPIRFESYSSKHLYLPLRRDILHRAVVFEGDGTRQGTANTKTRWEIHGSHAKIRPQKGTGKARLGTKQSPMLKGGAKVFGPRPRDFSTELPRKMYDLAWRTALSWRYRKGDLIICEDGMELEEAGTKFVKAIFKHNRWGKEDGRSLLITGGESENLYTALQNAGEDGRVKMEHEVDVKDLLELGRIIIEKRALDSILKDHQSDLISKGVRAAV